MPLCWRHLVLVLATLLAAAACAPSVAAQDREFDLVGQHVQAQYRARRKPTPFMGVANLAVKVVRPAGVKSFKIAEFEDLHSPASVAPAGLDAGIRRALGEEWQPLVHIHARDGEQTVVYAREDGRDVKLMVVIVNDDEATVLRVKLTPEGLAKWLENPKDMGLGLLSGSEPASR